MRPRQDGLHGDIAELHAVSGAHADEAGGPQGEALVLELRRLQRALEHNRIDNEREAAAANRRPKSVHEVRPKAQKRVKAARGRSAGATLASCLDWLGFGNRPTAGRRDATPSRQPPQRRPPPARPARPVETERPPLNSEPAARPQPILHMRVLADAEPHDRRGRDHAEVSAPFETHAPAPRDQAERSAPPADTPAPRALAPVTPLDIGALANSSMRQLRAGAQFLINASPGAAVAEIAGEPFSNRIGRAYLAELRTAFRVLIVCGGVAGGWATLVPLSGAVVLPGMLVVESSVKKVQHLTGGVVAEIPVRDGMHVEEGALLIRLDETQVRANGQLVANQLDQVRMRSARLIAERDGANEVQVPRALANRLKEEGIAQLVAAEISLFRARASARRGQIELLQSNIGQFAEQIAGLESQIASKTSQLSIIAGELTGVDELYRKGLVPLARLTTLQREVARLEGERGQLVSSIAETKAKSGQAQLQIVKVDQDFRADVLKDLREAQDRQAELTEKNISAQDQLQRIDIRAPVTGTVHQLAAHTVGGVIRPGDVIMEIVPDSDNLEIEARLPPNEIDQVHRAQTAFLRFSAFNQRTTPQVSGAVSYVSADLARDPQSNAANATYYAVRVIISGEERRRLGEVRLIAGMPVEVFLQTGSRTMLSYLFKPITDQFHRMFNER